MPSSLTIVGSVDPTAKFGEGLKSQVEERLKFLASGTKPRKNKDAMSEVIAELQEEGLFYGDKVRVKREDHSDVEGSDEEEVPERKRDKKDKEKKDKSEKKDKKDKKDKKSKKVVEESDEESDEEIEKAKKKDKKRSKH